MNALLVDTSAWIAYFEGNTKAREHIDSSLLETPSMVLAELVKVLARKSVSYEKISDALRIVSEKSTIKELDETQAIKAGWLAVKEGLKTADSIIYSYTDSNRPLLTLDSGLKGKSNVQPL